MTLQIEKVGAVLKIALCRPSTFNAFNREMALALQSELKRAEHDEDVRAILLTGEGRAFCSGQDLSEAIDPEGPGLDRILAEHYNPLVRKMRALPKPIVVAVNGVAAGAGANIALAGDVVVAAENASFIQAFSKIGLIPDTGGTLTLPRLVGPAKASAWMMLGDKISGTEAERTGMIYKAIPAEELQEEAMRLAQQLAEMPTRAFALTKQALNASTYAGLDAQLELERQLQNEAGETQDFKEGVSAFLEKRPATFTGK
jgi:2-(1,2-epoxy-1,2-dihydrophenyl)acetyl-CoA isomerase